MASDDHISAGGLTDSAGPTPVTDEFNSSEADFYACGKPSCDRTLPTSRGRGVHEQQAYKNWHDGRQVEKIDPKKAPWSVEEAALLGRQEARFTLDGTGFLNEALSPFFSNRTFESIKGQMRYQRHKDKVLQILREMEDEN